MTRREIESPYAWFRLAVSVVLATIGSVGMWSGIVALPAIEADFMVDRGAAALPSTLAMIGFGIGGVILGRLADRVGIIIPVLIGAVSLAGGYMLASMATSLPAFAAAYLVIGTFGSAATFAPLMADISHWFEKRRGIAVSVCACGNYVSGALWPTVIESGIGAHGWRTTHLAVGMCCLVLMPPLALMLKSRTPVRAAGAPLPTTSRRKIDLPPAVLQTLLAVAGLACCVAMAMPQVHIVAYCGDLGYGTVHGARMLSLMLGCGIISRIGSGFVADRLGGVATLLLGSAAQMAALAVFLLFDSLTALYAASILFGLFQGGLIPSYAIIVRESFPANQAGARVGLILMATLLGMALGGWMSGVIFDLTGSYLAAFGNGIAWNLLNFVIAAFLLIRSPFIGRRWATARHAGSAAE